MISITVHCLKVGNFAWRQVLSHRFRLVKCGFQRLEWQKLREPNEALDARVYATAAAWIIGVDRCSEEHCQALETKLKDLSPATRSRDMMSQIKKCDGQVTAPSRDQVWISRRKTWLR